MNVRVLLPQRVSSVHVFVSSLKCPEQKARWAGHPSYLIDSEWG